MKLKRRETPTIETLLGRLSLRFAITSRIREMSPKNKLIRSMARTLKKYRSLFSLENNDGANRGRNEMLQNRKALKKVRISIRRLSMIVSNI